MTIKTAGQLADLHIHTTSSDGTKAPEEVVKMALERGLGAIAITDHDSVGGIKQGSESAAGTGLEVVAGVELSSYIGEDGFHIVGLFINPEDSVLLEHLEFFRNFRKKRGGEIIKKLNNLGVKISMDDVLAVSGSGSVGRPHVAEALVKVGAVATTKEAFQIYIGNGKPAYVPKYKIDPKRAAEIIHATGGVAFLAHPGISADSDAEIRSIMAMGLNGIETVHAKHSPDQVAHLSELAESEEWLVSGGSDYHGVGGNELEIGECTINVQFLENIRNFQKLKTSKM